MERYKIDDRTNLIISNLVIRKLNKYRQLGRMKENGGILLGKIKADFSEFIIYDISEPCEKDKKFRYGFVRNKENAQKIINEVWKSSNGEVVYMGEWHSHPECNPKPSYVDNELIIRCSKEISNLPTFIFLIIIGQDGSKYISCKKVGTDDLKELNKEQ